MHKSLNAYERETVIVFNDEDDKAIITTWQRAMLTKLQKNPAAVETEHYCHGTSVGGRFEIDKRFISLRSKRRPVSEKQRAQASKMARDRQAGLAA